MNHQYDRKFKITLEYLAEGKSQDQLAKEYGLSPQRISQIIIGVYAYLGVTANPTAASIGLEIQRRVERSTRDRGIAGTPEWFHRVLEMEREEDNRNLYYQGL